MAVSSFAAANAFLALAKKSGRTLTNMQLQKLVYIAHGFTLATQNRPLVDENTEGWQYGPVIPSLYTSLRKYGNGKVTRDLPAPEPPQELENDTDVMEIIKAVWEGYGNMSGAELSRITHEPHIPWNRTWATNKFGPIRDDLIKKEEEKRQQREKYIPAIFLTVYIWLAFTAVTVLMSGIHLHPTGLKWLDLLDFTLSDKVLITLISATLLKVLGILFIVTK